MRRSGFTYKQEDELKDDCESYEYLRTIHTAMADLLFEWHGIRVAKSRAMSSVACVSVHDVYVCFETYFDDYGDTCHRVYDMSEAKRLLDGNITDRETRNEQIEERRKQIKIVSS